MSTPNTLVSRATALPAVVQGALLMLASALCFSVINVLIRELSASFDPLHIGFFRTFFALLFMLPWLARAKKDGLRTKRLPLHVWRACFGLLAMVCWFHAIAYLPLAQAVALNFTVPLFVTAGAALILGEVVRARPWSATIVGFLGVLVIVRPGVLELSPAMALPVMAAAFMAISTLMVKTLSRSDRPGTIVLYMNLIMTPLSLIPALFVWRWPDPWSFVLLALLGFLAALSHLFLTHAYARVDASAVQTFTYVRLPLVAAVAYFAFAEVPDIWTWIGAAIIVGSAIYIARREAKVTGDATAASSAQVQA